MKKGCCNTVSQHPGGFYPKQQVADYTEYITHILYPHPTNTKDKNFCKKSSLRSSKVDKKQTRTNVEIQQIPKLLDFGIDIYPKVYFHTLKVYFRRESLCRRIFSNFIHDQKIIAGSFSIRNNFWLFSRIWDKNKNPIYFVLSPSYVRLSQHEGKNSQTNISSAYNSISILKNTHMFDPMHHHHHRIGKHLIYTNEEQKIYNSVPKASLLNSSCLFSIYTRTRYETKRKMEKKKRKLQKRMHLRRNKLHGVRYQQHNRT